MVTHQVPYTYKTTDNITIPISLLEKKNLNALGYDVWQAKSFSLFRSFPTW